MACGPIDRLSNNSGYDLFVYLLTDLLTYQLIDVVFWVCNLTYWAYEYRLELLTCLSNHQRFIDSLTCTIFDNSIYWLIDKSECVGTGLVLLLDISDLTCSNSRYWTDHLSVDVH